MKTRIKTAVAVVATLLAVTLSGCGEDAAPESGETSDVQSRSQSVDTETPEGSSTETAAPLTAQPDSAGDDPEQSYITQVRDRLSKIQSQIPDATDEQLLAAANEACERLESGESGENMTLIDGEETTNGYFMDSGAIIIAARMTLCPIEE